MITNNNIDIAFFQTDSKVVRPCEDLPIVIDKAP